MKKKILITLIAVIAFFPGFSQNSPKIAGKLSFLQGQIINVTLEVNNKVSQEAMGNAIDILVDGTATHIYKITNTTDDNNTLHHEVKRFTFNFDGMGTKRSFDSDNKKDMDGLFGDAAKEILSKSYDMIIDPAGKTLLVKPEKIELKKSDDRLAIVFSMLKDVTNVVYPPQKNEPSFLKILPDTAVGLNESWTESGADSSVKFNTVYTLTGITDSTLTADIKGNSVTTTKAEMMGMQFSSTMNNTYTGKVIIDKLTGILREKTITTVSNGTAEAMGAATPVTSKTTIVIKVNTQQ